MNILDYNKHHKQTTGVRSFLLKETRKDQVVAIKKKILNALESIDLAILMIEEIPKGNRNRTDSKLAEEIRLHKEKIKKLVEINL